MGFEACPTGEPWLTREDEWHMLWRKTPFYNPHSRGRKW
jgi:hypothetical protein